MFIIIAYNELVCRLNWPNAHSHPTDLSELISPKDTASPLVRVHHLCEQSWLKSSFNLDKLILPNQYHTEPADWQISSLMSESNLTSFYLILSTSRGKKVKLVWEQVWAKVLKSVSRATRAPCGRTVPNKVRKHCLRTSTFQIQALERPKLGEAFCPPFVLT